MGKRISKHVEPQRKPIGKRPRVLVVDDEVGITDLVSLVLEEAGYEVLTACNGIQALEVARRELPGLVLLDVMMPGLDGREVSRQLKEGDDTADIPVVLFSATSVDLARTRIDAFIAKPFDLDTLIDHAARLTRPA